MPLKVGQGLTEVIHLAQSRYLVNECYHHWVLGCLRTAQEGPLQGVYNHTWPFPCDVKMVGIGGRENIIRVFIIGKKLKVDFNDFKFSKGLTWNYPLRYKLCK